MLLPLSAVLRRGVVFLHPHFPHLADPSLAGQTKPKYLVVLSGSPLDDPVLYILTTSHKPKHSTSPFKEDFVVIKAGKYPFWPQETIINAGQAGDEFSFSNEDFAALYDAGELIYQGVLDGEDIMLLLDAILASLRVANRTKQILKHS
jgi:hypothetical protein